MSKIRLMSDNLANKIAAGEVIERIANVVKELVENSIDAGSKNIKIELEDAGKKLIRVTDDGFGMDEVDARAAFQRHATSKLYKDDDLFFINTLGFRGEALPSIAAVAEVKLETYDGTLGTSVSIKGGKIIEVGPAMSRQGTIISVTNLFYNTPARLKYLKSEPVELSYVTSYVEKLSLAHPDISFTLVNNKTIIHKTSGQGNLLKTIYEIYGTQVSTNMIGIQASNDDYDISGYISKPIVQRSTRNFMNTIINDRVIRNPELNKIINDAYATYKPDSTFPIVVIKIDTDPTLIDVNIHPSKENIKFSKMESLKALLTEAIKNALYGALLIPDMTLSSRDTFDGDDELYSSLPKSLFIKEDEEEERPREPIIVNTHKETPLALDLKQDKNGEVRSLELYPVGIALGTYIIAENDEGVYLIDQHAAVERINYEDVLKGFMTREKVSLLVPITLEFQASQMTIIKNHEDYLESIGFEIEEFGRSTIRVNAHPAWIKTDKAEETICTFFDVLMEEKGNIDTLKFNDKVAATIACKKSLKGNTRITLDLAEVILSKLVLCDNPYNCPHGRPTIIKFTKYELEKMFKRAGI